MRQYRILTHVTGSPPVRLEKGVHASLYNIPEVRSAVEFLKDSPNVDFIGININNTRRYSLVVVHEDELKPDHFQLGD